MVIPQQPANPLVSFVPCSLLIALYTLLVLRIFRTSYKCSLMFSFKLFSSQFDDKR
jgi:cell division protein FtsW (lipid II flippase)